MKTRPKHFDFIVILLLLSLFVLIFIPPLKKERVATRLTVKVTQAEVKDEIIRNQEIFLNSVNEPVIIEGYKMVGDHILITLEGPGLIEENRYIFNGQRVLVGQKAELHGKFWAQGIITEVKYAD